MKLSDIKTALVEQFFKNRTEGLLEEEALKVLGQLKLQLNPKRASLFETAEPHSLSDPAKSFSAFLRGSASSLLIAEDTGIHEISMFAAVRTGKQVAYADLTVKPVTERIGDLKVIKQALKQAKLLNDDAKFLLNKELS